MNKSITLSEKDIARFWSKVEIGNPDECWEWKAYRDKNRYGKIGIGRNVVLYVNRMSWMITYGNIPEGMVIAHKCDNPPCVNPSHLFMCTQAENMHDMKEKGRARGGISLGEKHGLSKLKQDDISVIMEMSKTLDNVSIAKYFSVHPGTIGRIINKKTWSWLK